MNFTALDYLQTLNKAYAKGDATEHTHRAALQMLIEAAGKQIEATNEPKAAQRENKPDYVIRSANTLVGFVEAKDIGVDLKATLKTPQLKRYLEALPNLILTNYVDFVWLVRGEKRMEVSLGTVGGKTIQAAPDAEARWDELISSFIAEVTPLVDTPKLLAQTLGGQTRLLRDLVGELVTLKDPELSDQLRTFRALLLPDLSEQEFADMYAQTAAYGLFTARVFEHTTLFGASSEPLPYSLQKAPFSLEKSQHLIPKANPFLRQFFQHVASPNLNHQLRWLVEQIANGLHYVDMDKVLHRQGKKLGFEDPVFHFYESFLAEYDRALRESRGVYYTPEPVVDFIVRGVDWLLKEKLGKPDGLADKDTLILDPAAGTATFLRKVIDHVHSAVTGSKTGHGNAGMWPQYVSERLLPRIFGFELMMAPYTVAHLKLALQLQEQGFTFGKDKNGKDERLNVYLTNTLDTIHKQADAFMSGWIAAENQGAEEVKRSSPVQVVLGNPPYSGVSRNNGKLIQSLIAEYKKEPSGGPLQERKHWLNDDYVKFIRFAHDRITRTGHGVVAFITNHGWLDNPTFRGMRASLMRDFDDIYVLDLHGNAKKQERTPTELVEQGEDKNVFDIEQGVSIVFLVKLNTEEAFSLRVFESTPTNFLSPLKANIYHQELWGSREWKYDWLDKSTLKKIKWTKLKPARPLLLFKPRQAANLASYSDGYGIFDIFKIKGLGIQTSRDDLAVGFSQAELALKLDNFSNTKKSDQTIRDEYFGDKTVGDYLSGDTRQWDLKVAREQLQGIQAKQQWMKNLTPVLYRPFDNRCVIYQKAMIDWPRPEVMQHLHQFDNLALCLGRTGAAIGSGAYDIVFCTSSMTDHNLFRRGGATTIPLWLKQTTAGKKLNLSPQFLEQLATNLGVATLPDNHDLPKGVSAEDVLAYLYAVLHAPSYRSRYAEYLKSDFPRIPIQTTADSKTTFANVWQALLPLGRELIDLHLLKKSPRAMQPNYPQAGDNEVEKPRFDKLSTNGGGETSGAGRVYINKTQYFDGVPEATWNFKVGGYQVCEKWLKDRKGRTLTLDEIEHYQKTVAALTRTRELMLAIDAVVDGALWPSK